MFDIHRCLWGHKAKEVLLYINFLASGCFQGFSEKKRLNARGFAREFLWSSMLYRPGESLKNAASLLVCTRKKIFLLGG